MRAVLAIPDHQYEAAEREAERAGKSRSRLYADAMVEYLLRHAPDEITEAMNQALEAVGEQDLDFTRAAARHTLERIEWQTSPERWPRLSASRRARATLMVPGTLNTR